MKTTTVTEAKAHLSRLLGQVRRGETVLILHRGQPVARLEPFRPLDEGEFGRRIQHLVRTGVLKQAALRPDAKALGRPPPRVGSDRGLLDALLAERKEGR